MNQQHFNAIFTRLTPRRREVLQKFLANQTDKEIAKSLYIEESTVRKHIEKVCKLFGLKNEFSDERRPKRRELIALFAKYKPELFSESDSSSHSSNATDNPVQSVRANSVATLQNLKLIDDVEISNYPNFVGREEDITKLNSLVQKGEKIILLQAEGGIGKTTLAYKWFEYQGLEPLTLRVGTIPQHIHSVEDWVRQKLQDYFREIPAENFMTMLEQLRNKLQNHRVGVLIDNLEPALIKGELIEAHQSYYIELLTVLAHHNVQSITLITSREPIYEPAVKCIHNYSLEGLNLDAWKIYFETKKIIVDIDSLSQMHQAYGGNAEAMSLLSSDVERECQGNLQVYWQQNHDYLLQNLSLEKLVQLQFDKLQKDYPTAHKLLCRLGCYRYHYIPAVNQQGLFCLLWDVEDEREKRRIVKSLHNRSLIKFDFQGYYLHRFIREEAVERLKSMHEWKDTNRKVVQFWAGEISKIITSEESQIQKINFNQIEDYQEYLHLLITTSEEIANHSYREEYIAFEFIYQLLEYYKINTFDELILKYQELSILSTVVDNFVKWRINLGVSLYQLGIETQKLAEIDNNMGNYSKSREEFEFYQKCFQVSQSFLNNALWIAKQIKSDKLVNEVQLSLFEFC